MLCRTRVHGRCDYLDRRAHDFRLQTVCCRVHQCFVTNLLAKLDLYFQLSELYSFNFSSIFIIRKFFIQSSTFVTTLGRWRMMKPLGYSPSRVGFSTSINYKQSREFSVLFVDLLFTLFALNSQFCSFCLFSCCLNFVV